MVPFVTAHLGVICTGLALIISEVMSLSPKVKANGIAQAILALVLKKAEPIVPPQA